MYCLIMCIVIHQHAICFNNYFEFFDIIFLFKIIMIKFFVKAFVSIFRKMCIVTRSTS